MTDPAHAQNDIPQQILRKDNDVVVAAKDADRQARKEERLKASLVANEYKLKNEKQTKDLEDTMRRLDEAKKQSQLLLDSLQHQMDTALKSIEAAEASVSLATKEQQQINKLSMAQMQKQKDELTYLKRCLGRYKQVKDSVTVSGLDLIKQPIIMEAYHTIRCHYDRPMLIS